MILEIILLLLGLVIGFFFARWILSKQKWEDKEKFLDEKWKRQIAELEKEYSVKMEQNKTNLEKINREWQVKYIQDIEELKRLFKESEKVIKTKSVSGSRRSLVGKFIERFIPFLKQMPFEPSDMHFIGSPIDYIVFEGLHEDNVQKITFVEVKTGSSKLTKREKSLKEAVEKKKISWKEIDIDTTEENVPDKEMENEETTINELYENINQKVSSVKNKIPNLEKYKIRDQENEQKCDNCGKIFMLGKDEIERDSPMAIECPHCHKYTMI